MSVSIDAVGISLVAVIISAVTFFFAYVKGIREQEQRITKLETKMELIWNYVDDNMGKILHSPHTPEIDVLIEKMPPFSNKPLLSLFEAEKLKCLLIPHWEKEKDPYRKKVYGLYLARLDSLIIDKKDEKRNGI